MGRPGLTSLTISPVLAGRLSTDPVAGITREGAVEVGAGVDAGAAPAVAPGERAVVGRGVADGCGVAVADGSDADGSGGRVTVGSDADGSGDPVATGSEGEAVGRIVAIGTDAVGSGTSVLSGSDGRGASVVPGDSEGGASVGSSGRFGPTAAADIPSPTNPPIRTSAATATATAPRPAP